MTLRGRLTLAFLLVVLGPILISAFTVGMLATTWTRDTEAEDLRDGGNAIATTVSSLCDQARTAAGGMALAYAGAVGTEEPDLILGWAVERGAIDAARVVDTAGRVVMARGEVGDALLRGPWEECTIAVNPQPVIAGSAPAVDGTGAAYGTVQSAFVVDEELVSELRAVSGLSVAIMLPDGSQLGRQDSDGSRSQSLHPGRNQPLHIVISTQRKDLRGLYFTLALITVVVAGAAVLAARWLALTLTGPLNELAHAAEEVGIGNLSTRVPVRGGDETARLARTFNRMIHDLEKYVGALRASRDQLRGNLANLGQALGSGRDVNAILELTVQTAMAATGAHAGVVFMTRPGLRRADPPTLVGRYGRGLPVEMDITSVRLPFGDGLLGQVAAAAAPRRGRVAPGESVLSPLEPMCRTYIAVPFLPAGSGEPLGVLALYDRLGAGEGADDFDDADLETLQSFASQAATALASSAPSISSDRS